jgi:hypothetical protein
VLETKSVILVILDAPIELGENKEETFTSQIEILCIAYDSALSRDEEEATERWFFLALLLL